MGFAPQPRAPDITSFGLLSGQIEGKKLMSLES